MQLKPIIFTCLLFSFSVINAQNNSSNKITGGTIFDDSTNEPVPFASVAIYGANSVFIEGSTSDINGYFPIKTDSVSYLVVVAEWYKDKIVRQIRPNKPLIIKMKRLARLNGDEWFKIDGKPVDTIYYLDKKIKRIHFQYRDSISYYENGQMENMGHGGSYREWYANGKLKSQSIGFTSESWEETEWYDNGQMKSYGFKGFAYSDSLKMGTWHKSGKWKYWDKDGKEIKK